MTENGPHLPVGVLLHQRTAVHRDGHILHAVVLLLISGLKAEAIRGQQMSKEGNYCLVPSKSPISLSTNEKQEHSENVYVLYTCTAHTQQALTEKIHWKQQSAMLSLLFFPQDATEPKTISASSVLDLDLCLLIAASRKNPLSDFGTNIWSLFQFFAY